MLGGAAPGGGRVVDGGAQAQARGGDRDTEVGQQRARLPLPGATRRHAVQHAEHRGARGDGGDQIAGVLDPQQRVGGVVSIPRPGNDRRQRVERPVDCVQVVIALVVTPDGFPLAYEVMPGNTADNTTLADFLTQIEDQYGRSDRVWIMDRGIPTEHTLEAMREGDAPVRYLVGTPKGRLTRLEKSFLDLPWQEVRQSVDVKLLTRDAELYVLVRSERRVLKERSMRRRRLKKLWKRLGELRRQSNRRDQLMLKLGAAKKEAGRAWFLVEVQIPHTDKELAAQGFAYRLRRE